MFAEFGQGFDVFLVCFVVLGMKASVGFCILALAVLCVKGEDTRPVKLEIHL